MSNPSSFNFKGNNKRESVFKRVVQVASSQLLQEIHVKRENIVSLRLSFKNNSMN